MSLFTKKIITRNKLDSEVATQQQTTEIKILQFLTLSENMMLIQDTYTSFNAFMKNGNSIFKKTKRIYR